MSDLFPMYARLRGTLADEQPATPAAAPCRHPRAQRRIERTEEDVRAGIVRITTTVHCGGCGTVVGHESHPERRR